MKQVPVSQLVSPKFERSNTSDTRLQGYALLFARTAWVVVAAFSLSLFLLGLPSYAAQLHTICTTSSTCYLDGALSPAGVQALRALGVSVESYIWYTIVVTVIVALIWASIGFMIFWHRSNDWMALLTALFLVTFNLTLTNGPMASLVYFSPGWNFPVVCLGTLSTVLEGFFFYLFPSGRFVPRWMGLFLLLLVPQITSFFLPPSWAVLLNNVVTLTFFCTVGFSHIYRYRHVSTSRERQQTKWVLFGIFVCICGGLALTLALTFAPSLYLQSGLFDVANDTLWFIVILPVPLSIGVAMLRYRLWDIDIIINRTLVYGTLTTCIVGLYALIVGTLSSLLQVQGNFLISLLATGLVAVLFHPLRERLQRAVNRLFYGQRDEPYKVISHLGNRLEATLAPDRVLPTIVETTAHALKLPYIAIALQQDRELVVAAATGTATADLLHLPLRYQTEQLGEMQLAPRAPGEPLSPVDLHLLEDLTRQVGMAVYAMRLNSELQELASELQQSRTQLVTAREEERRRLRRDLHDGLGSVLASLNLRTGAIRALLRRDIPAAQRLLEEQQSAIRTAIADIRRLVYALRPPSLDELGLVGALREQAAHYTAPLGAGLHVTIEAPEDLPPLSAAIEVAAYRIVQEALVNVERHAQAHTCCVQLMSVQGALHLEITDDGVGVPIEPHLGVGLQSMRERAAELSGSFQIQPGRAGGTQVAVSLPLIVE